ncbi:MAG: homocysteine S-methyltransferase [Thermoanaerobaculia bacterium]
MTNLLTTMLDRQGVVMLDGGLATELERRGRDLKDDLWSARVLMDQPELVGRVHADYLAAGADCIVSASYQATVEGFVKKGLSQAGAERLLQKSVEIALEARDIFWSVPANRQGRLRPLVAASIGPYGAFLADGSEFTGDYDLDEQGLADFHADRWQLLAGSGADLLACETIPSATEARVLLKLLEQTPSTIAWFSFSCRDDTHISDGTELAAIAQELSESEQIVAVGANCTAPRFISGLVTSVQAVTSKPIVVYPNSGESWDAEGKRWIPGEEAIDLPQASRAWRDQGARLIGGCCRTGPEDIRRIRRQLLS